MGGAGLRHTYGKLTQQEGEKSNKREIREIIKGRGFLQ